MPAIALAWLLHQPVATSVIVGAKREEQLAQNLAATDIELTSEDLATLDSIGKLDDEYPGWALKSQETRHGFRVSPPRRYQRSIRLMRGPVTGLLGGSFNPAHGGHRRITLFAIDALQLDEVWWLVSPGNPLKPKKGMAPLAARVRSAQGDEQARADQGDRDRARTGHALHHRHACAR